MFYDDEQDIADRIFSNVLVGCGWWNSALIKAGIVTVQYFRNNLHVRLLDM